MVWSVLKFLCCNEFSKLTGEEQKYIKTDSMFCRRIYDVICVLSLAISTAGAGDEMDPCDLRKLYGLPACLSRENVTTYKFCTLHEEHISQMRTSFTCDDVRRYNPLCRTNFTVAYVELLPYVQSKPDGSADGIMITILQELFIKRCCLGCSQLETLPPIKSLYEETLSQIENSTTAADIMLPVFQGSLPTYTLPYIPIVDIQKVVFIAKKREVETEHLMTTLIFSTIKTWPLFVMSICLAICAGTFMWILDTWRNKNQFPRRFPNGPFEGFWWAYVSMTTVGYGDRTPSTPAARVFAVIWILIGITVFNMFTASLTAVLTNTTIQPQHQHRFLGKNVGVLKVTHTVNRTVRDECANPIAYETTDQLKDALLKEEVFAIAMEKPMAIWFLLEYQKHFNGKYKAQKEAIDSSSPTVGIISRRNELQNIFDAFLDNKELADISRTALVEAYEHDAQPTLENTKKTITHEHISFTMTIIFSLVMSVLCTALGIYASVRMRKVKRQRSSSKCNRSVEKSNGVDVKTSNNNCRDTENNVE